MDLERDERESILFTLLVGSGSCFCLRSVHETKPSIDGRECML